MKPQRATDSQKRIVVIDDDALLLELVERRLRGVACEAIYFNDELDGLAYLRRHKPDILIVDQRMPRLNGIDLLSALGHAAAEQVYLASSAPLPSGLEESVRACGVVPMSKDKMVEKGYLVEALGLTG